MHGKLVECIEILKTVNSSVDKKYFSAMDYFPKDVLFECYDIKDFYSCKDNFSDFIFRVSDLVELKGKKYKSRRHIINKFSEEHPNHTFRPYKESDFEDVMRIRERWISDRFGANKKKVWDYYIFQEMMKLIKELGLRVFVMEVDGKIEGFITIAKLGKDCSMVINENTNLEYQGMTEKLWYLALGATSDFGEFSNDGNGGNEKDGLFRYKMSHNPVLLIPKVTVIIDKIK